MLFLFSDLLRPRLSKHEYLTDAITFYIEIASVWYETRHVHAKKCICRN